MLKDYYEILSVPQDASLAEIKQRYQKLLLIHHPDKQQQNQSQQSGPTSTVLLIPLQDIKEAWECLREPARRDFYDSSLKAMKLRANGQVNDDIDLDDMDYDEGRSDRSDGSGPPLRPFKRTGTVKSLKWSGLSEHS